MTTDPAFDQRSRADRKKTARSIIRKERWLYLNEEEKEKEGFRR